MHSVPAPKLFFLRFTVRDSKISVSRILSVNIMQTVKTELTKKCNWAGLQVPCCSNADQISNLLTESIPAITADGWLIDWVLVMIQVSKWRWVQTAGRFGVAVHRGTLVAEQALTHGSHLQPLIVAYIIL